MMVILYIKLHIQNMKSKKLIHVTVKGIVQNSEVEQLRNGVKIDDYITKACTS